MIKHAFRPAFIIALLGIASSWAAPILAQSKAIAVDCIASNNPIARTPTDQMNQWLAKYSSGYNVKTTFTVGGHGAMNRMFNGSGRLIHHKELAEAIKGSSQFTGKKAKFVELGVSGTGGATESSYAHQLGLILGTKVIGCEGVAYYLSNGLYICGQDTPAKNQTEAGATRLLPIGFMPIEFPMFMAFCVNEGTSPDPRTLLSSQAVYGLFPDELAQLEDLGKNESSAAFRLYQYHWIARRNKEQALKWLRIAADLGSTPAKYNLAYEDLESREPDRMETGRLLVAQLISDGVSVPDLAKFYSIGGDTND